MRGLGSGPGRYYIALPKTYRDRDLGLALELTAVFRKVSEGPAVEMDGGSVRATYRNRLGRYLLLD